MIPAAVKVTGVVAGAPPGIAIARLPPIANVSEPAIADCPPSTIPRPSSAAAANVSPPSVEVHPKIRSVTPPPPQFQQLARMSTRPASANTCGTGAPFAGPAPGNDSSRTRSQAAPPAGTRQ
jgi:hypothetical protein